MHRTQRSTQKWVKDINIRPETIKPLEENIGEKRLNVGLDNDFLAVTAKAQVTKAKIDRWHYRK